MMDQDPDRRYFRLPLTLGKEEYGDALRTMVGAARTTPGPRTKSLQSLGKFAIYAFFGLTIFVLLLFYFHWNYQVAVILATAIFALHYIAAGLHFRWTDAWLGFSYDPDRHGQGVATFDETGARLLGPAHEQAWNWSLLRKLHAAPELYVVEFAALEMLVIPRSAFSTTDEEKGWSEMIRERLPLEQ